MVEAQTAQPQGEKERAAPFRWGFASAALTVLGLMLAGSVALGVLGRIVSGVASPWQSAAFGGFALAALSFVVLQRAAVARFFRAMHVGVTLVTLSVLAVAAGVLVPQITGFEDPEERVPSIADVPAAVADAYLAAPRNDLDELPRRMPGDHPALATLTDDQVARLKRWKTEYSAFRWAEGFFVYHLVHLYGFGKPEAALPGGVGERLDVYEDRYGVEHRENTEKQMRTAFQGRLVSQEIGQLVAKNDRAFRRAFELCTALDLNRTYKSNWFATLLGLLFTGVAFNTFKGNWRRWFTLEKLGYKLVHLGVMTLLAGGVVSKLSTSRGVLHLELDQPPQVVYDGYFDRSKPVQLPFGLKLDRFARRDWKTLEIGFTELAEGARPPTWTLWPGRVIELDYVEAPDGGKRPRIRIEVQEIHERALVGPPRWWEAERRDDREGLGPLAHLVVQEPDDGHVGHVHAPGEEEHGRSIFLSSDPRGALELDPYGRFRLLAVYDDVRAARALLAPPPDGRVGWLSMRVLSEGDVEPRRVPLVPGATIDGPGGFELRVVSVSADLRFDPTTRQEILDPRPLEEQVPRSPGVVLEIHAPHGSRVERRVVSALFTAREHDLQKDYAFPELELELEWDHWGAPGPPRNVLAWSPAGEAWLVREGEEPLAVQAGATLALGRGAEAELKQLLHNVRFEPQIEFDAEADYISGPQYDEHFYAREPTGVVLKLVTDPGTADESSHVLRMAATERSRADLWSSADDRFWLRYYENKEAFPFEWRSVLSVWEREAGAWQRVDLGHEAEREIRVNDYFTHAGYRFFQSNADPRFPNYSGIGVVYDPGIPFVLYGMYLTIAGAAVAFLLRPIARARAGARA